MGTICEKLLVMKRHSWSILVKAQLILKHSSLTSNEKSRVMYFIALSLGRKSLRGVTLKNGLRRCSRQLMELSSRLKEGEVRFVARMLEGEDLPISSSTMLKIQKALKQRSRERKRSTGSK